MEVGRSFGVWVVAAAEEGVGNFDVELEGRLRGVGWEEQWRPGAVLEDQRIGVEDCQRRERGLHHIEVRVGYRYSRQVGCRCLRQVAEDNRSLQLLDQLVSLQIVNLAAVEELVVLAVERVSGFAHQAVLESTIAAVEGSLRLPASVGVWVGAKDSRSKQVGLGQLGSPIASCRC